MSRKWTGFGRERHDNIKVAVMVIALFGFIVVWVAFAAGHDRLAAEPLPLASAAITDPSPGATATSTSGAAVPAASQSPSSNIAVPK